MSELDPGFETGYDNPSLDHTILFGQYADDLAAHLRQQYRDRSGYHVTVVKKDKNPKLRSWDVNLYRGWFAGSQVTIQPIGGTPHRVMVQLLENTKLAEILTKGFAIVSLLIFLLVFLAFVISGHMLIGLAVSFFGSLVWLMAGAVVLLLFSKLCARIFGNEFDFNRRSEMARDLKLVLLPKS